MDQRKVKHQQGTAKIDKKMKKLPKNFKSKAHKQKSFLSITTSFLEFLIKTIALQI